MNYLERNELILQEIKEQFKAQAFKKGEEVGKSSDMKFTPVGFYRSQVLSQNIDVGLKESIEGEELETRANLELARIAVIAKHQAILVPYLPAFYGYLVRESGETAIVTEDFSQGGRQKVEQWPYRWANLPNMSELLDRQRRENMDYLSLSSTWLFIKDKLTSIDPGLEDEVYDLTSMCFIVNNRLRLGDFDMFLFCRSIKDILAEFPIDCTFEEFVKYIQRNRIVLGCSL